MVVGEQGSSEVNIQCQRSGGDWNSWKNTFRDVFYGGCADKCWDVCVCVNYLYRQPRAVDTRRCCMDTPSYYGIPSATWWEIGHSYHKSIKMDLHSSKIKTWLSVSEALASRIIHLLWLHVCVCWPQYLACLKTSRSQTDKLSFDVGLQEDSTGKRGTLETVPLILVFFSLYLHSFFTLVLVCFTLTITPLFHCFPFYLSLCTSFALDWISPCFFSASRLILPLKHSRHTIHLY